jgi:hypothetical protein
MTLGERVVAAIGRGELGRIPEPTGGPSGHQVDSSGVKSTSLTDAQWGSQLLGSLRTSRRRGVDSVCTDDEACVGVGAFPTRK